MFNERLIEVRLSPQEIMDHVDDMLAWEAIAGQSRINFEWSHFLRAVPLVLVGSSHWGMLTPNSLQANEQTELVPGERVAESMYLERALPEFLEQPLKRKAVRYAHLIECNQTVESHNGCPVSLQHGEDVSDLETEAGWRGLTYHLESIGEVSRDVAKLYQRKFSLPDVARVFLHQHVLTFADGRAASRVTGFAYWNRRFFGFDRQRLLDKVGTEQFYHPSMELLATGILETLDRAETWGVEISLGAKRTGVELRTDAIGARAFVKLLRAAETPSGRRKSIVHWVNDHMRRRRASDANADVFVQGHLRGMQSVPCGRYHARVWPAQNLADKKTGSAVTL